MKTVLEFEGEKVVMTHSCDGCEAEIEDGKFCPVCLAKCPECGGLTYVIREYGETPCPECQQAAYIEHKQDLAAGF